MFKVSTTIGFGYFPNDYVVYYVTWLKIPAQAGICPSFDVPQDRVEL